MQARLQQIEELIKAGNNERACAELLKLVSKDPHNPAVLNALAITYANKGEYQRGLYYGEMATRHAPANPIVWRTYANLLGQSGKYDLAAAAFDKVLALSPADAGSWLGKASIERFRENLDGAIEVLRRGIAAAGEHELLLEALVAGLNNAGHPEQAMEQCTRACSKYPDSLGLAALACNTSLNVIGMSRDEVFKVHCNYGEVMKRRFPPPKVRYQNRRESSRKLRIGVVSSDLRRHSVAFFVEPLFRHIDQSQFEIWVYSTSSEFDAVSEQLKPLVAMWRDAAFLPDSQLAATIYADQIDILIDLHGFTQGHRLGVFHNKPAPVQMTYLGYPNTTGLAAMDYRIIDEQSDPTGTAESIHAEKLLRLDPCFLCFTPPAAEDCPAVGPPAERPVTFGCFNALHKLSDYSIGLWAKVLAAVPDSRMIIKCPVGSQKLISDRILNRFESRGVDAGRIQVLPVQKTLHDHLQAYQLMDIALDPFPYHGTTTTCEALFMGVPVVTLAGDTHVRRVGVSILNAAGCGDWVATSEDEYIAIAAKLARDQSAVASQRAELREKLVKSPLCDGVRFTLAFSTALRAAWASWCASGGEPA